MNAILKVAGVLALLFVVCVNSNAQDKIRPPSGEKVRLGALYKSDVKGRHDVAIQKALQDRGMESRVDIEYFEYLNEEEGLNKLIEIIEGRKVDIVLGPTDSGVFLRALQKREDLERYQIPVISSLVTAPVDNRADGWFFRTNVDVHRRAETIFDFLSKYWIRSITVLYADTEFGRLAEENFRKELRGAKKKNYQAIQCQASINARPGLKQILDNRPGAVGIFGSSEDIKCICSFLKCMNYQGYPYNPILFTVVDARQTDVYGLYYVSLAKSDGTSTTKGTGTAEKFDEVEALAYDTTKFVLNEIEKMPDALFSPQRFRDQFASVLSGPPQTQISDLETGMTFDKHKNIAQPEVFQLLQNAKVLKINLDQEIGWAEKMNQKLKLLRGRYGYWPVVNFVLLILVGGMVSILDLKRWYEGSFRKLFLHRHFYLVIFINVLLAFILYVFLAETGRIRYDSVIAALIIALTPSAFLRATLFETPTGKSIGLGNLYDRFLLWINDKLMMVKYQSQNSNINVIAYHNSLPDMKSELNLIYQNARNVAQRSRLQNELDEQLQKVDSHLERRRICARRLLRRLDWEELKGKRFVPKEPEAFSDKNPTDPRTIVRESVRYCSQDLERRARVENLIKGYLDKIKQRDPESYQEIKKELKEELQDARSERGKLFVRIRFLFVQLGFNVSMLKKENLLRPDYKIPKAESFWRRKWDSLRTWFRSKKGRVDSQQSKNGD